MLVSTCKKIKQNLKKPSQTKANQNNKTTPTTNISMTSHITRPYRKPHAKDSIHFWHTSRVILETKNYGYKM